MRRLCTRQDDLIKIQKLDVQEGSSAELQSMHAS